MKDDTILQIARILRPAMRKRTPVLYRVAKWTASVACPKGTPVSHRDLVAPFEGGLLHVDTSSSIEYHLLFRGCHEPHITDLIRDHVRPGAVCMDIGANVGAHTLLMAQAAGPSGHVVALEPHPALCNRLRANLELNKSENVEVIEAALSETDGTTDFYGVDDREFNKGLSSLQPTEGASNKMIVRTVSGSTLLGEANIQACDFIKIDVEGHEAVVVQQLWELVKAQKPVLIFEYRKEHWGRFGATPTQVISDLREFGYTLSCIHKRRVYPMPDDVPESCEILAVK